MTPTGFLVQGGIRAHRLSSLVRESLQTSGEWHAASTALHGLPRLEHAMTKYFMVGLGGFLGAIARFWLGGYIGERMGTRFPYGTFVINISGSFVIGFIMTLLT